MLDLRVIAVIVEPGERKGCVDEVGCEPFAGGAVACDHTLSLVGGNISEERFLEPAFRPAKPGLIAQQGCHLRWPLETFRCVRDRMSMSYNPITPQEPSTRSTGMMRMRLSMFSKGKLRCRFAEACFSGLVPGRYFTNHLKTFIP